MTGVVDPAEIHLAQQYSTNQQNQPDGQRNMNEEMIPSFAVA